MAFQLSPGVNVTEIDLTTVVPTVSTSVGAIAGLFNWGPVGQRVLVDTEDSLVKYFGKPSNYNAETWFTAANFLSYNNSLYVSRGANTSGATPKLSVSATLNSNIYTSSATNVVTTVYAGMYVTQSTNTGVVLPQDNKAIVVTSVNSTAIILSSNAIATNTAFDLHFAWPSTSFNALAVDSTNYGIGSYVGNTTFTSSKLNFATNAVRGIVTNLSSQIISNNEDYDSTVGNFDPDVLFVAKYPGSIGSSLRVSICDSANAYSSAIDGTNSAFTTNQGGYFNVQVGENFAGAAGFTDIAAANVYAALFSYGDKILAGNSTIGYQYLVVDSVVTSNGTIPNPLKVGSVNTQITTTLAFAGLTTSVNNSINFIIANNAANTETNPTSSGLIFRDGDVITYANNSGQAALSISGSGTLSNTLNYYVINANTSGFKLANTPNGDPIPVIGTATSAATFRSNVYQVRINFQEPYRLHTPSYIKEITKKWEFHDIVNKSPGQSTYVNQYGNTSANDEVHIIIVDDDGKFSGTPGTILEVYNSLSRATDAKSNDGSTIYYKDVINQSSAYIWWANDRYISPSANSINIKNANEIVTNGTVTSSGTKPLSIKFNFGQDGYDESDVRNFSSIASAYDKFVSTEDVDISLILSGRPLGGTTSVSGKSVSNFQLANYIIDNICEVRKDCVAFISPDKAMMINTYNNVTTGMEASNLVAWRGAVRSTSYSVLDGSYKYQYDRYNDVYRWIPLNGDIAGLCARTDHTNDAWWSPAGFNRGQIKNTVRLGYNPKTSERDLLYVNGINPVVTFPGQGTVLYGDKTLQAKPSSFDHINVRRLFIVLEKAISRAAKYSLFEFNDPFTRSQFKNLITPYLRQIQGRRGITDFYVVCDETNNTPQVIDLNQFVGDIYIKPARSINFIQLNFVAVGTGVQFSEVIGKF